MVLSRLLRANVLQTPIAAGSRFMQQRLPSLRSAKMSTVAESLPEKYSNAAVWFHWLTAAGVITCVGTVKLAQWTPKDDPKKYGYTKGELMNVHKSTALLVLGLAIPRVATRLITKQPPLPEGSMLEHGLAKLSHGFFYFALLFLPMSGIAMGYYGGKGLPFFGYHISGAEVPNKSIAGNAFKRHKNVGELLTYFLPLHVGAVGFHFAKGQNILKRILP